MSGKPKDANKQVIKGNAAKRKGKSNQQSLNPPNQVLKASKIPQSQTTKPRPLPKPPNQEFKTSSIPQSQTTKPNRNGSLLKTNSLEDERDISRLRTENRYLREALNRLHKDIIGGDETAPNQSQTPQETKDYPTMETLKDKVNEVADKFHETKEEAEYTVQLLEELNKYSGDEGTHDTPIRLPEPPIENARPSSKKGNNIVKQKHEEQPRSEHDEQLLQNFKTASRVLAKLREAEYAARLLKELGKYSGDECTSINLPGPPMQKASDISKEGNTRAGKQNEQHQINFKIPSIVLQKMINATIAQQERESLLLSLDYLSHVRNTPDGDTEAKIMRALDQIQSSVKNDSSANKGFIHAKEILVAHMDVRRNAEKATKDMDSLLAAFEYLTGCIRDLYRGNLEVDISSPLDHFQSLFKRVSTAKQGFLNVKELSVTYMKLKRDAENAIKERNCLLQALQLIFKHIRDQSEGNAEEDTSTTLDHLKSSIDTDSTANEGLSHAKAIQLGWKRLQSDLGKKKELVDNLTSNLKRIQHENAELRIVADELRTRLSEHAGLLITYGNPSITDLSDPNRPTKLSEKYSEIYDNQWTDAFENISKRQPKSSDKELAGTLLDMLEVCYSFCEETRRKQKLALEDSLFNPPGSIEPSQKRENEDINKLLDKSLSDAVKLSGSVTGANVAQAFVKSDKIKKMYGKLIKLCDKYLQDCVQLCWLMQVQTPPLCIDLKTLPGQPFDKNCYREYTKIGEKVAFVVWPALFLHENGPTLYKGIAQGQ